MAETCWLYYFSKFIEMLDTVNTEILKCVICQIITFIHLFLSHTNGYFSSQHSDLLCSEEEK